MSRLLVAVALAAVMAPAFLGSLGLAYADSSGEKPYPISASLPANVQTFLRLEVSPSVFNVEHHYGHVTPAANGAYLDNVKAPKSSWYVEDQRYGSVDVLAGVLHDDRSLLQTGLGMFGFALHREASNGSFPGSVGLFHGTAMFLAEAGPAMIVLKYWQQEPKLPASMRSDIRWQESRMHKAGQFLIKKWYHRPGHIDDGSKEDRFFEGGIALESVGVLTHDSSLSTKSKAYVREGIRMTRPNGVMPENGGHDSSYQALGLTYAVSYRELTADYSLRNSLAKAVGLGEKWLLSRVRKNGTVNRKGDDRTGPSCPERSSSGKCKVLNLTAVCDALMDWGVAADSSKFVRRSYMVWLQNWKQVPGDKLPAPGLFDNPSSLSQQSGQKGKWIMVNGTRFQPLEGVKVYFNGTFEGKSQCDQIGSFGGHSRVPNVHFTLPTTIQPGTYTITAKGQYGTVRKTTLTVTG